MEPRTLGFIAEACEGELRNGDAALIANGVSTDTRTIKKGDLFVALSGENFDGHKFISGAAEAGAVACIVEKQVTTSLPLIIVKNTRIALKMLAARYKKDFAAKLVAVVGSNGKTTTKDLLGCLLASKLETLASRASFNNDIGIPMTLLRLQKSHEVAVLEAGTNHPGELEPLLELIEPQYGVLTSIGREHLEFFKNLEGVAQEEGVIAEKIAKGGKLFLNADTPYSENIAARAKCSVVTIGREQASQWQITESISTESGLVFWLKSPREGFSGEYRISLFGKHQAYNAALAIAVAVELGLSRDQIEQGLGDCKPSKLRLQRKEIGGVTFLDDSYNANADSMAAALEVLQGFKTTGRKIAVLGDMAELGQASKEAHYELGKKAAFSELDRLFLVGSKVEETAWAAQEHGFDSFRIFQSVEEAAQTLNDFIRPGDLVLIKASRSMRFERIAQICENHHEKKTKTTIS